MFPSSKIFNIEYYSNLKVKVYKDYVDQIISKEDYLELNNRFQATKEKMENAMADLERKQNNILSGNIDIQSWIDEMAKYQDVKKLNRNMVVSLINKVEVSKEGNVQVTFAFNDELIRIIEKTQEAS